MLKKVSLCSVIAFRVCEAGHRVALQMSMSSCSCFPVVFQTKLEHCIHCNALMGRLAGTENSRKRRIKSLTATDSTPPQELTVHSFVVDPPARELDWTRSAYLDSRTKRLDHFCHSMNLFVLRDSLSSKLGLHGGGSLSGFNNP